MSNAEKLLKKRKKRFVIRAIVLSLLVGAIIFTIATRNTDKVLAIGDEAPDFELVDLEGNTHRLSDYRGQGVFLNFWGTWCPPCKAEMPYMENQSKNFDDVHILAVNIKQSDYTVKTFRDQYGLTFPIVIDKNESVRRAFDVLPLPTTILINKDGIVEDIITREMTEDEIRGFMESIQPT